MKTKLLITTMLLLAALEGYGQKQGSEALPAEPIDSLSNFAYLYKGQPMPFDSGVAISDRQYQYVFKHSLLGRIIKGTEDILTPVPRTVYVEKQVRKKGDGNKTGWFAGGVGAGAVITALVFALTK